jgi:WD40 repeat protein
MNFCPESGYLYSVDWSPTRPCVFACGSHKGNILIYDLMEAGTSSACQVLPASESPIYTVSFNKQRSGYLASGDRAGTVKIWKLSQNLTKTDPAEVRKLNDISEKPFEDKN